MSEFIRLYREALPAGTCADIIAKFDQDGRKINPHVTLGGYHTGKSSLDLVITNYPDWAELDGKAAAAVGATFAQYRRDCPSIEYAIAGMSIRDIGFQIQAYTANGVDQFDWHVDNGGRREPGGRRTTPRILAGVLYLNDVAEGGETEFSVQRLKFKPEAGAMLWFPPSFEYPHRGCKPISGPKYVVSTFMVYGD